MIKRILIAVDGSSSALNAAEYAIQLAKQLNATVQLVHVVRHAVGNIDAGILPKDVEQNEEENAVRLIARVREKHPTVDIQHFETVGLPDHEIAKVIRTWEADLFVIGHHTHGFLQGLLIDSVESDLLKHLKIPLLIIPEKYSENES